MTIPRGCTCTAWGPHRPSTTRTSRRGPNWPVGAPCSSTCRDTASATGPRDFGYTLDDHANALAAALDAAGATGAELIAHSMGGSVAIVLAHRRPDLVSRLVLTEANLDPSPPVTAGSSGIASYEEDEYVSGGHARVLEKVGPQWAATMRLADPRALHRTAIGLFRGSDPTMRRMLEGLAIERVYLQGALSGELKGRDSPGGGRGAGGDGARRGAQHHVRRPGRLRRRGRRDGLRPTGRPKPQ